MVTHGNLWMLFGRQKWVLVEQSDWSDDYTNEYRIVLGPKLNLLTNIRPYSYGSALESNKSNSSTLSSIHIHLTHLVQ